MYVYNHLLKGVFMNITPYEFTQGDINNFKEICKNLSEIDAKSKPTITQDKQGHWIPGLDGGWKSWVVSFVKKTPSYDEQKINQFYKDFFSIYKCREHFKMDLELIGYIETFKEKLIKNYGDNKKPEFLEKIDEFAMDLIEPDKFSSDEISSLKEVFKNLSQIDENKEFAIQKDAKSGHWIPVLEEKSKNPKPVVSNGRIHDPKLIDKFMAIFIEREIRTSFNANFSGDNIPLTQNIVTFYDRLIKQSTDTDKKMLPRFFSSDHMKDFQDFKYLTEAKDIIINKRWIPYEGKIKTLSKEELNDLHPEIIARLPVEDINDYIRITQKGTSLMKELVRGKYGDYFSYLEKDPQLENKVPEIKGLKDLPEEELIKMDKELGARTEALDNDTILAMWRTGKTPLFNFDYGPRDEFLFSQIDYPKLLVKFEGSSLHIPNVKKHVEKLDPKVTTAILMNHIAGDSLPSDLRPLVKDVKENEIFQYEGGSLKNKQLEPVADAYKKMLPLSVFSEEQLIDYFTTCLQTKDVDANFFYDAKVRLIRHLKVSDLALSEDEKLYPLSHEDSIDLKRQEGADRLLMKVFSRLPFDRAQQLILEGKAPISLIPEDQKEKFKLPESSNLISRKNYN